MFAYIVYNNMKTYGRKKPFQKFEANDCHREIKDLCRLCLSSDVESRCLFEDSDGVSHIVKIVSCTSLDICEGDGLPTNVCSKCIQQLDTAYKFQQKCLQTDKRLRDFLQSMKEIQSQVKILKEQELSQNKLNISEHEKCEELDTMSLTNSLVPMISEPCKKSYSRLGKHLEHNQTKNIVNNLCDVNSILDNSDIAQSSFSCDIEKDQNAKSKDHTLYEIKDSQASINIPKDNNLYALNIDLPDLCSVNIKSTFSNNTGEITGKVSISKNNCDSKDINTLLFGCELCPKRFARRIELKRHNSVHNQQRGFVCSECEKWFPNKTNMKRHERIHTGERPFCCSYCKKCFSQESILSRHLLIHTGVRPFKCDACGKDFTQREGLKVHMRLHNRDTAKIIQYCPLCDKSFSHRSGLSRHLLVHTGKKFKCTECSKLFTDQSSLKRHSKYCHKLKNETVK